MLEIRECIWGNGCCPAACDVQYDFCQHDIWRCSKDSSRSSCLLQAAEEAAAVSGGELQQVEEQLAALDAELTKQGGTQAPASKHEHICAIVVTASLVNACCTLLI